MDPIWSPIIDRMTRVSAEYLGTSIWGQLYQIKFGCVYILRMVLEVSTYHPSIILQSNFVIPPFLDLPTQNICLFINTSQVRLHFYRYRHSHDMERCGTARYLPGMIRDGTWHVSKEDH